MPNEAIFILFLIINLLAPIIFLKGGKAWLYSYIAINGCILIPIAPITTDVFGYALSVGTVAWAPIYLITDILTERYGKHAAIGGALLSSVTAWTVLLFIQMVLFLNPSLASTELHNSLGISYQYSVRMIMIGTFVFLLSQMVDIHIYDYLHKKTGEKYLWLRNNASTLFTTFFNNVLFWGLAFGNVLENWFATAMAAYLITVVVALCDTPFIYLAKRIKPVDLK